LSRSGLSQVTVIFEDGTEMFFARQLVNERLQFSYDQLPEGVDAMMGPISTGVGEIFLWTVVAREVALKEVGTPYTATVLRVIQD
ncbi:efflux RND transporter permease subunit, partial [Pseudomonas syringae group genomosp. 7]|uniref:efflux RND transporter permease subunit n=1 Tax=Pseudomonas syringae group genomosp. 7 TaxID=251699 RepID=UPI00376F5EAF